MVEVVYKGMLLHISYQFSVGSLKLTVVGISTLQKSTNAANQGFYFREADI